MPTLHPQKTEITPLQAGCQSTSRQSLRCTVIQSSGQSMGCDEDNQRCFSYQAHSSGKSDHPTDFFVFERIGPHFDTGNHGRPFAPATDGHCGITRERVSLLEATTVFAPFFVHPHFSVPAQVCLFCTCCQYNHCLYEIPLVSVVADQLVGNHDGISRIMTCRRFGGHIHSQNCCLCSQYPRIL